MQSKNSPEFTHNPFVYRQLERTVPKILITGATGFIGQNLAKRLLGLGYDVICTGRSLRKLGPLRDKVKQAFIDLQDKNTVLEALGRERPDIVYHCAALVRSRSLAKLRRVNVEGTRAVLDACLLKGVKKVVYLSSVAAVSGNPDVPLTEGLPYKARDPYGQSKAEAEEAVLDYRKKGLKIAILRPCMVYGKNEPHGLGLLVGALKLRIMPVFGKGANKLHLVSVDNLVDVMVLCLSKEEAYEGIYFVADKEVLSIKEIFFYISKILGIKPPVVISEKITEKLAKIPLIGKWISFLSKDRVYSIKRLEEKFGYIPRVSVYDGLKEAVLPYKNANRRECKFANIRE